jgi:hypothetical protein
MFKIQLEIENISLDERIGLPELSSIGEALVL